MQSLNVGCSGQWLSGKDALVPPVHLARLENLGDMAEYAMLAPGWDGDEDRAGTSSVLGVPTSKPSLEQGTKLYLL